MTLSSDSEDDLPPLSQRIGVTKPAVSSKDHVNGGIVEQVLGRREGKGRYDDNLSMECRVISDEVPSKQHVTGPAALSKDSAPDNTTTTAAMVIAHNDAVSMPTASKDDHMTATNNKHDVITINDDLPTISNQIKAPVSSNFTDK